MVLRLQHSRIQGSEYSYVTTGGFFFTVKKKKKKKDSSLYSSLLHTCIQFLQLLRRALLSEFKVPQRVFPFLIIPTDPRYA